MTEKITFQAFIDQVAARTGLSKRQAHDFVKELAAVIDAGLIRDGKVRVAGLGTFQIRPIAESTGINPQTGDVIVIPSHSRVLFKAAKALARRVNREYNHLKPVPVSDTTKPEESSAMERPAEPVPEEERIPEPSPPSKPSYRNLLIAGGAAVVVVVLALLLFRGKEEPTLPPPEEAPVAEEVEPALPTEPVPEEPAPITVEEPVEEIEVEAPEAAVEEPVPVSIQGVPARVHHIRRGDTLWDLAKKYYGKSSYWPLIFQANRQLVRNPDFIMSGFDLVIPLLEGTSTELTLADSANLATGYAAAYEAYRSIGKANAEEYIKASRQYE
ncbi:MAG: HU family DNA-binding protein [Fidelibacterota bacterium]|nr:MAG: HU family DNA-binding protein [Candidatus Neomarinimicrobiota bacterium]